MSPAELAPLLPYAKGSKVAGVLVALVCFGIGAVGFADSTATIGIQLGLAIPFGIIGLAMLFLSFRPADKHPAIVALRDRAHEVAWIYASSQTVNGRPSQTFINVCLASGSKKALAVGVNTDPNPLIALIAKSLPHATFGYTPELEAVYKKTPHALLKRA